MFCHDPLVLPHLEKIDGGEVRLYETPDDKKYPSVTSILGKMLDHSGLDEWRARVGDKEADWIGRLASTRGTAIHDLCEKYVLNQNIDNKSIMPFNFHMFKQMKLALKDVNNIRACEAKLYSDKLKAAGSCDLIADYKGVPSIIDYKTSNKNKTKDYILGYFLQATFYSFMLFQMTGLMYTQIVIIIAVEEEDVPQIFIEDALKYIDQVAHLCKKYHALI